MSNINIDFFNESDSHRTLALEVEDRKFWVPRDTLAMFSPVFKAMLYGDFVEANKDVIRLPDKKASDILELLLCLMPTPHLKEIDDKNLELLIGLANEYQIEYMQKRCETVFIKKMADYETGDKGMLRLLLLASDHKMRKFLEPLVKKCAEDFTLLELQAMFDVLNSEVIAALMLYKSVKHASICQFRISREHCPVAILRLQQPLGFLKYDSHHDFGTCIRCNFKRCIDCMGEYSLFSRSVCSSAPSMKSIEDSVRALLNRM